MARRAVDADRRILTPTRLVLGTTSTLSFVVMTSAMGPVLLAEEPQLVGIEQTTTSTTPPDQSQLHSSPPVVIVEVPRSVTIGEGAAPAAADRSSAPSSALPASAVPHSTAGEQVSAALRVARAAPSPSSVRPPRSKAS